MSLHSWTGVPLKIRGSLWNQMSPLWKSIRALIRALKSGLLCTEKCSIPVKNRQTPSWNGVQNQSTSLKKWPLKIRGILSLFCCTFQRECVSFLVKQQQQAASEKVSLFRGSLSLYCCTFQRESVSFLVKHTAVGCLWKGVTFQRESVSFLVHFSEGVCLFFGEALFHWTLIWQNSFFMHPDNDYEPSLFWC